MPRKDRARVVTRYEIRQNLNRQIIYVADSDRFAKFNGRQIFLLYGSLVPRPFLVGGSHPAH